MVPRRNALRSAAALLAAGAGLLGSASTAAADDGAPLPAPARAPIGDEMRGYYASEKTTAFIFVGVGSASAVGGGVLLATAPHGGSGDFARGLGGSLLGVGALEAAGAAFYALQVGAESAHYEETLARDPSSYKREELTHIHGTTSRFVAYRLSELGLALAGAGVATYGFVKNQDTWKGVGIGVAAEAITFFTLDSFGQARAKDYEDQVRRFEPQVGVQVGGGARPWGMSVGGLF
jgi:hypothetical protein